MYHVHATWATEMGLEVRPEGLFRDGTLVFPEGSSRGIIGFLTGYEQAIPQARRDEIHALLGQIQTEERAYHLMWGTAIYMFEPEEFWKAVKLAWSHEKRTGDIHVELDHSFALYMGNKWQVVLLVVIDEPSEVRTAMLKAMHECLKGKGLHIVDEAGNILPEFLGTLWYLRENSQMKKSYTPEILTKLRGVLDDFIGPLYCLNETGKVVALPCEPKYCEAY